MKDVLKLIDSAVYGDMRIDYLIAEGKYACCVYFEDCRICDLMMGESIEEAYRKTVKYLERLRHRLDTWR